VGQDPQAGFVTDTVTDEVVYVMENLGMAVPVMRRRLEDTLDLMGLVEVRDRPLRDLSGGQQQRVAIAAVLAAGPRVLVLDEPTSALDPAAADEVLSALTRLVHDVGLTVVMAEHRLERVVQFADQVVHVAGPGPGVAVKSGPPREMLIAPAPRPPVVLLGEFAGWDPLPLTVREARRHMAMSATRFQTVADSNDPMGGNQRSDSEVASVASDVGSLGVAVPVLEPVATATKVVARYGNLVAVDQVSLDLYPGQICALMGRNGSGKSTLLTLLAGMRSPRSGTISVEGADPATISPQQLIKSIGLVPQNSSMLLFCDRVIDECTAADQDAGASPGTTAGLMASMVGHVDLLQHPRDLSEGQRLALAIAVVMAARPKVLCLDEPTRGLDYEAKAALVRDLESVAAKGTAVLLATHDVELVAELAHRVVLMAHGQIVEDGPTRSVVCQTPVFSPQVARVTGSQRWLTVDEVRSDVGSGLSL